MILENLTIFLPATTGKTQALKRYILFILIGSFSGLFLRFLLQAELEQPAWSLLDWGYWALLGLAFTGAALWVSSWLDQLVGWQRRPGLRWLIGWLINTVAVGLVAYVGFLGFRELVAAKVYDTDQQWALLLKGGVILAFLVLSYTVIYFANYSYRFYGQMRLSAIREERQRMELQWEGLRAQLKPHFLFNNLNTISALLEGEEVKAEAFIRNLANTYRFMLRSYEEPTVPVRKELQLAESYFYLLQSRYPGSLQLQVNLSEDSRERRIPPLALQLLIENAVKHNRFSKEEPLIIQIAEEPDHLCIQNDVRPRSEEQSASFAIGLDNLRLRYALLKAPELEVAQTEVFIVKIPLLA